MDLAPSYYFIVQKAPASKYGELSSLEKYNTYNPGQENGYETFLILPSTGTRFKERYSPAKKV
jgi:hypothetical protein